MLELTHYNDHKEKESSHTVSMTDKTKYGMFPVDFTNICGYGGTYEEALEDFKKKFDETLDRLQKFETMLFGTDALVTIEVDCLGK